jgi:diguanylate cyclase (GGDEF)-like protein
MPPQKQQIDPFGYGLATAGFAGLGGVVAPLTALPVGAAAMLCGLPAAVAAAIAGRKPGIFATIALGVIGSGGVLFDGLAPPAIASSVFVIASATATLVIATTRRRRHERTVFGLERLNHQILGDATRRPEYHVETYASVVESHEATLIALHELQRRVATHTSAETLLPTIIAAARSLTSSQYAAVYFWESATRSLQNAFPQRSRDVACYVPDPSVGAAGWVIATQQVYTAATADTNPELAKATAGEPRRPGGIAPLIAGNDLLGLLIVDATERHAAVPAALLANIANIAALGLRSLRLAAQARDAARRDAISGFIDRLWISESVSELRETHPETRSIGVIGCVIDQVAAVQDQHGCDATDSLVREVSRLWKAFSPERAITFRLDHSSFLAVVTPFDPQSLREIADGFREAMATHPLHLHGVDLPVTTSMSIAEWQPEQRAWNEVLSEVEETLRRCRTMGGNRVWEVDAAPLAST